MGVLQYHSHATGWANWVTCLTRISTYLVHSQTSLTDLFPRICLLIALLFCYNEAWHTYCIPVVRKNCKCSKLWHERRNKCREIERIESLAFILQLRTIKCNNTYFFLPSVSDLIMKTFL